MINGKKYNNLRIRSNNRVLKFIKVLTLCVGFISSFAIFLYLYDQQSYDDYHLEKRNIYRILVRDESQNLSALNPFQITEILKDNLPEIRKSARIIEIQQAFVKHEDDYIQEPSIQVVDPSLLEIFTIDLIKGNTNSLVENKDGVIISENLANSLFNNKDPINSIIKIKIKELETETTVVGIMKNIPRNSTFRAEIIGNIDGKLNRFRDALKNTNFNSGLGIYVCSSYLLLDSKIKIDDFSNKANNLINKEYGTDKNISLKFQNIQDLYLNSEDIFFPYYIPVGNPKVFLIFLIIGIICICSSVFNYLCLSIALSDDRLKEVGVKKVFGISNSVLSKQFILESFSHYMISFLISLFAVYVILPYINNTFSLSLNPSSIVKPQVILSYIALAVVLSFVSGWYLAFYINSKNPSALLAKTVLKFKKQSYLFKILLCLQLIIFIAIFSFSRFVNNQLQFIQEKNLGYNSTNILKINGFGAQVQKQYGIFKESLLKHPSIISVSASNSSPPSKDSFIPYNFQSSDLDSKKFEGECIYISPDFLKTFEIELINGRYFDYQDYAKNVVLINQEASDLLFKNDPVGLKINKSEIIGITKNINLHSLYEKIIPLALIPLPDNYLFEIQIKFNENIEHSTIDLINKIWQDFFPDESINYTFIDDEIRSVYALDILTNRIIKILSLLLSIITVLGLFNVSLISIRKRTKEFAIHRIHGANRAQIIVLIMKEYLPLSLIAFLIGTPISYYIYLKHWLTNFAYKDNISIALFFYIFVVAIVLIILSIAVQSIKNSKTEPANILKQDY